MDKECDDMHSANQGELVVASPRAIDDSSDNLHAKSSDRPNANTVPDEVEILDGSEWAPLFSDEDICDILNPLRQINTVETSGAWTAAVRERLYEFSRIKSKPDAVLGVLSILQIATTLYDYQRYERSAPVLNGIQSAVFDAILHKISKVSSNERLIIAARDYAKKKGFIEHVLVSNATLSMEPPSGHQEIAALSILGRRHLGMRFDAFHMVPIDEDGVSGEEISEEQSVHLKKKNSSLPDYKNPSRPYLLGKAAKLCGFRGDTQDFKYLINSCNGEMATLYTSGNGKSTRKWIFNLDDDHVPKGVLEPMYPDL